jgi:hypothetical protein
MEQSFQDKKAPFDLDELLHPSKAFRHPLDVVRDPDMTVSEKRSVLGVRRLRDRVEPGAARNSVRQPRQLRRDHRRAAVAGRRAVFGHGDVHVQASSEAASVDQMEGWRRRRRRLKRFRLKLQASRLTAFEIHPASLVTAPSVPVAPGPGPNKSSTK